MMRLNKTNKSGLSCRETMDLIPSFLDSEMELSTQQAFLKHVKNCENCMEELRVSYLFHESHRYLDEGLYFDVDEDFKKMFKEKNGFVSTAVRARIMLLILIGLCLITLLLYWTGVMV